MSSESNHDYLPHQDVSRSEMKRETDLHVSTIYIPTASRSPCNKESRVKQKQKSNRKNGKTKKKEEKNHTSKEQKQVWMDMEKKQRWASERCSVLKWTSNRQGDPWLWMYLCLCHYLFCSSWIFRSPALALALLSSSLPMSPFVIGCVVLQPSVNYAHCYCCCCCCPHQLFYCLFLLFAFSSTHTQLFDVCYRFALICLVEVTHAQNFYHSLQEWKGLDQTGRCA